MSHQPAIAENGSKCEDTIDAARTLSHRNLLSRNSTSHARITIGPVICRPVKVTVAIEPIEHCFAPREHRLGGISRLCFMSVARRLADRT
jgi:hypothetical protein